MTCTPLAYDLKAEGRCATLSLMWTNSVTGIDFLQVLFDPQEYVNLKYASVTVMQCTKNIEAFRVLCLIHFVSHRSESI